MLEDDSLVHTAKEWLRRVGPDFYRAGLQALVLGYVRLSERSRKINIKRFRVLRFIVTHTVTAIFMSSHLVGHRPWLYRFAPKSGSLPLASMETSQCLGLNGVTVTLKDNETLSLPFSTKTNSVRASVYTPAQTITPPSPYGTFSEMQHCENRSPPSPNSFTSIRLFSVDEISGDELVFGEIRPRIRHRLRLREALDKPNQVISPGGNRTYAREQLRISSQTRVLTKLPVANINFLNYKLYCIRTSFQICNKETFSSFRRSLYRRPPEAADSLDRPPWNIVKRRWMTSAMAPEADLLGRGVSPRTDRGSLGEFAEAGMVYGFSRL
ncbi:hypothetical protein ANN_20802 [Periplaneta americana]|uniref:Uncharacterized protein n=1 Tax=Periplaneta americana TaxID=6978 RepID=A0ABQ8SES5_PERAM|nr:hypothetical protein ANN_20802 [Periplaneta americana]